MATKSHWKESPLVPLAAIFLIALILTYGLIPLLGGSAHSHDDGTVGHTEEYPVHADFRIVSNGTAWTHEDFGFTCVKHVWQLPGQPAREVSDHVAHVPQAGQSWREYFASLNIQLDGQCVRAPDPARKTVCNAPDGSAAWRLVVNGRPVPFNPDLPVGNLDRVLFDYSTSGATTQNVLDVFETQVTNESCVHEGTCPGVDVDAERC